MNAVPLIAQVPYPTQSRTDFASRPDLTSFGFGEAMMGLLLLGLMFAFIGVGLRPRRELEQLESQAMKFSHKRRNAGPTTLTLLLLLALTAFGDITAGKPPIQTKKPVGPLVTADVPVIEHFVEVRVNHDVLGDPPPLVVGDYFLFVNQVTRKTNGQAVILLLPKQSIYGERIQYLRLDDMKLSYTPTVVETDSFKSNYFRLVFPVRPEPVYYLTDTTNVFLSLWRLPSGPEKKNGPVQTEPSAIKP